MSELSASLSILCLLLHGGKERGVAHHQRVLGSSELVSHWLVGRLSDAWFYQPGRHTANVFFFFFSAWFAWACSPYSKLESLSKPDKFPCENSGFALYYEKNISISGFGSIFIQHNVRSNITKYNWKKTFVTGLV